MTYTSCHWCLFYWVEFFFFGEMAPRSSTCVDKCMTITTLPLCNELNAPIFIFVFVFKVRAFMHLTRQLILWNAIWWKFLAASSMASVAKEANLRNDIASQ